MLLIDNDHLLEFEGRAWRPVQTIERASLYEEEKLILAILRGDELQILVGLDYDLNERFRVIPPAGRFFYYLTIDVESNPAVVCAPLEGTGFEWNFGVNPKNGELTSLSRAY